MLGTEGLDHADQLMIKGDFKEIDFLSLLSDRSRRRLLAGAKRTAYRAGDVPHCAGGPQSAAIVEHGLIRIYWNDPDGRQATIAFMSSSELVGGTTLMGEQWAGASVQAVVDTTLLWLDVDAARRAAATEIGVGAAVATHLAAQVKNLSRTIAVRSLGNVSQTLAFDILERACRRQLENGRLEAKATHSDLADSIGSSREVVGRALKDLRVLGIVETLPGVVRVNDPGRLAGIVRGFEFQVTQSVA
ncbi:MAG TPA: Crp/Fnr family transcriptional regulator [Candidatus Dormibacteraeota bacterium]